MSSLCNSTVLSCQLQQAHLDVQTRAREEMGIEPTDFGETRTPFQLQILARVQALEISDV